MFVSAQFFHVPGCIIYKRRKVINKFLPKFAKCYPLKCSRTESNMQKKNASPPFCLILFCFFRYAIILISKIQYKKIFRN